MCRLIIGHQVPGECPGRMRFGCNCNCNSHARASHSREFVIRSSGVLENLSSEPPPPPASEPMRALVFVLAHNQVAHCFKTTCAPLNSSRDSISRSSRILTRLQPTIKSAPGAAPVISVRARTLLCKIAATNPLTWSECVLMRTTAATRHDGRVSCGLLTCVLAD